MSDSEEGNQDQEKMGMEESDSEEDMEDKEEKMEMDN